ncbi:hypothetical protein V502_07431 [Pseudogymnoascus sp. VKM F-4520 (FW-2644)]|nr:hypothetical protein V502_07431 [Pseudogymnoascus sp. VKM F-4520 (FW-2644)]
MGYQIVGIAIAAAIYLFIKYLNQTDTPKIKNLPEVPGLPLFGSLLKFGSDHATAAYNYSKTYGPVFQVRLGNRRIVFANTFDSVRHLWITNQSALISRPTLHTFHTVVSSSQGFTVGTSPWDESCKNRRKAAATALNRPAVQSYMPILDLECNVSIKEILQDSKDGTVDVDPIAYFQRFALNTSLTLNYGSRIDGNIDDELLQEICHVERVVSNFRSTSNNWQDYIPLLRLWPSSSKGPKEYRERRDKYLSFLLAKLKDEIARGVDKPCITGNILKDPEAKLSTNEIKSICLTMVSAGLDTVPGNLIMGIAYLSSPHGQEIQKRAYDEIMKVYPDGDAWEKCILEEKVPYVSAFVREVLRFFIVIPICLPRTSIKDIKYENAVIPAGTTFYMNAWAADYDSTHFKNPQEFSVERYLDNLEGSGGTPHFAYGAGSRMCAGSHLANRELYIAFVRMIVAFHIDPAKKPEDLPILDALGCNAIPTSLTTEPKIPLPGVDPSTPPFLGPKSRSGSRPQTTPFVYPTPPITHNATVSMQNILETQVSDLSSLVDSPLPLPLVAGYAMSDRRGTDSAESPARDQGKRKSDDLGTQNGGQPRAKRNRYISIACNECKRRKIKCNGNSPCQRCGNLNLECQYAPNCCANGFKDSEEFKQMNAHLSSLQEQIDNLYANLNALRSGDIGPNKGSMTGSMSQRSIQSTSPALTYRPPPKHPRFQGPTSSAFSFDVAKNTLQNMGYPGLETGEDGNVMQDDTPAGSPPIRQAVLPSHPFRDPLWSITKEEALRLCVVYEDEICIMYPFLDMNWVVQVVNTQYRSMEESSPKNGLNPNTDSASPVEEQDLNIIKLVLATASAVECSGQSEFANRLFENTKRASDNILHAEGVSIKDIPLVVLVATYHFHCDEEALAWRVIGQASRMCVELGLHRRDSLFKNFPDEEDRANAVRLFWSIYCLDRRWSFGTGMPFAMQDADIDPSIPGPEVKIPYLSVMISYSRIGSRVWRSVAGFDTLAPTDIKKEDIGYLDYQILQWQKAIPPELQLPTNGSPQSGSRAMHRLQVLLYLRCNQMRILIYRPVLHSANSIMENLSYAQTVVELAKDSIRALTHLNQTTDIYRAQQQCFNYFLISALAVIFLASCHAPVQFSALCKDEFYMSLELVRGFSSKSYVSKRLWRTIKGLKEVGPKLGLEQEHAPAPRAGSLDDPHSSAALAMAGLAGHEISGMHGFMGQDGRGGNNGGNGHSMSAVGNSPINGFQMSHEMTNLFEAALGAGTGLNGGYTGPGQMDDGGVNSGENMVGMAGGANAFGGDDELYRQLRDLF